MRQTPYSVSELTGNIKELLEENFDEICLQGEISGLSAPSSGHLYFSVKDPKAQISGVMFRHAAGRLRFAPENGQEVLLFGRISVYEPRGSYQILVDRIEPLGAGALQLAFEQLKKKLLLEGLFEAEHKKELPFLPKGIGIVTSPTGAVIRDILNILGRRFPNIPVLINPVRVQGEGAAAEIAQAIKELNQTSEIDVLILARGGGSIEDLWAFNEEVVARAIFDSSLPVISAVGHETDFTIADFTADLRAATPSEAAELIVPIKEELVERFLEFSLRISQKMEEKLTYSKMMITQLKKRLRSPKWFIEGQMLKLDEIHGRMTQCVTNRILTEQNRLDKASQNLSIFSPSGLLEQTRFRLNDLKQRLIHQMNHELEQNQHKLSEIGHGFRSLNPLSVLKRGYAIVTDMDDETVSSVTQLHPGSNFKIGFKDGDALGKTEKIINKSTDGEINNGKEHHTES